MSAEDHRMKEFEELLDRSSVGPIRRSEGAEVGMRIFREDLEALLMLDHRTPAQTRRVAELMEILQGDVAARPWWERAAESGDRDAVDYLAELEN